MVTALVAACSSSDKMQPTDDFQYCNERFADIEMLRYKVDGFENLTLKQKTFIYHLQHFGGEISSSTKTVATTSKFVACSKNYTPNTRETEKGKISSPSRSI